MNQIRPKVPDRLIDSAIRLMTERALLPTVREIATEAGVSASLVNYRFGSLEALYQAALICSVRREEEIWIQRKSQYLVASLQSSDLPGVLNELFVHDGWAYQNVWAMRWMRFRRAIHHEKSVLPVITSAETAFWSLLGQTLKLDSARQEILVAFYHGLSFGHLLGAREPGFQAWSSSLVNCLCQRLLGDCMPVARVDSAYRDTFANLIEAGTVSPSDMHPTRRTILEAAADILVLEGVNALTHRRLAKAAGASLSSVVHFFETRRIILKEAYGLLYHRLQLRALEQLSQTKRPEKKMTVSELANALSPHTADIARARKAELIGLLNAMFEASRDEETRAVALSLFARSGETSRGLLSCIGQGGATIGWLDAQVFRLVSNGLAMISGSETEAVAAEAEVSLNDVLSVLFADGVRG